MSGHHAASVILIWYPVRLLTCRLHTPYHLFLFSLFILMCLTILPKQHLYSILPVFGCWFYLSSLLSFQHRMEAKSTLVFYLSFVFFCDDFKVGKAMAHGAFSFKNSCLLNHQFLYWPARGSSQILLLMPLTVVIYILIYNSVGYQKWCNWSDPRCLNVGTEKQRWTWVGFVLYNGTLPTLPQLCSKGFSSFRGVVRLLLLVVNTKELLSKRAMFNLQTLIFYPKSGFSQLELCVGSLVTRLPVIIYVLHVCM
jgi:hypothetical protein